MSKIVIYQVFPRYFGNIGKNPVCEGTIDQNGCGKLNDFSLKAFQSIRDLGVSHVWFTGILEHATKTDYSVYGIAKDHPAVVKGKAGSPYAIKDYYDVDPDLAVNPVNRLAEFKEMLKRCHQSGLKAIIDFVPNHVARQYHSDACPEGTRDFGSDDHVNQSFNPDNNFYYLPGQKLHPGIDLYAGSEKPYVEFPAKVTGNDCFNAYPGINDWYETVKLNYGVDYQGGGRCYFQNVPATWFKMLDVLSYWTKIGVDGFRCDMAEMVPVEFWEWSIHRIRKLNPDILFIAEIYKPGQYHDYLQRGGFDYLYDKMGMYDTVRLIVEGYGPTSSITGCWQSVNVIQSKMLYFFENHDEQRLASDFFAKDPVKGFPALIVLACMQTNPFMLYSGQELGETGMYSEGYSATDGRSTIFDYWTIDSLAAWNNSGKWNEQNLTDLQKHVRSYYKRVLHLCMEEKSFSDGLFFDLMYANDVNPDFNSSRLYAFLRKAGNEFVLVVANFSDESIHFSLNIPRHAFDCLAIPDDHTWLATDLMTEETIQVVLSSARSLFLDAPANSGLLLKCTINEMSDK
ncbi:MAG: alpha-amylase family glycosyl hydrolase [Bacteroidales bacterium]|nr:alpha-amylase family glycosyl hydrolase [Bacteroidales bacterium]